MIPRVDQSLMPTPYVAKRDIALVAQGNPSAFARLFQHYRDRIFYTALRFLKSRELAEEVVQDVFLKVWMKRGDMVKVMNFEGYLFTMARNLIFDSIKAIAQETSAIQELAHSPQHVNDTDDLVSETQYEALLHKVVNELPPQQKQIFRLARMEGLSHQAIAAQLQISRLTVKTHMAKALQTIRQSIHHHITTFVLLSLLPEIIN